MSDRIVYLATDYGVDGRDKRRIVHAAWSMEALTKKLDKDPAKAWRNVEKEIADTDAVRKAALAKLNGLDKLVLEVDE